MARPSKKGKVKAHNVKAAKKEAKEKIKSLKTKRKEMRKEIDSIIDDFIDASAKEEIAHYAGQEAKRTNDEKKATRFGGIEMKHNNKAGDLRDRIARAVVKLADNERKLVKAKLSA